MQTRVIGYSYGFDEKGKEISFKHGEKYPVLYVRSQYGWRNPADRDFEKLINVTCISGIHGDACSLGGWTFECEEIQEITEKDIPIYTPQPEPKSEPKLKHRVPTIADEFEEEEY